MVGRDASGALAATVMLGLLAAPAASAQAAELTVRVRGVASGNGNVLVALCTPESFLKAGCPYTGAAPAQPGTVSVTVAGVAPGTYAIQAFHDANANMDLDRTLIGFPKEGLGFGNDARIRFGPPRFADAAVTIGEPTGATGLTLRYFR